MKRLNCFGFLAILTLTLGGAGVFAADKPPATVSLNGTWSLWFDAQADWQQEKLTLNPASMAEVPTHAPTVGWDEMLAKGEPYRVPATWDEVYPHRHGVGWYWRTVRIPKNAAGMNVRLRFAAVRLRAEVYWNRRLVGYSLDGFTPFTVDVSSGTRYGGENLLAVRVTNPGGGNSWMDFNPIHWGDVDLPDSHDFGGIWQDVDLMIRPRVRIEDIYVAPQEDLETVNVSAEVVNADSHPHRERLNYRVYFADSATPLRSVGVAIMIPARGTFSTTTKLKISRAKIWSPANPNLYRLVTSLGNGADSDSKETSFGVRFFTEKDGRLFLNGHRVVIRSSINFGFYPYTVSYPTKELAEKEVRAAKSLGLNTLSCHRTACTPALLDAADRLGLMIYEEPGGAPRQRPPEPQSPAEAFERQAFLEKLSRLVIRDRNHPGLVWWNMANEAFHDKVDDPRNLKPYIEQMMRETHRLDPSRFVTYTSGKQSTIMFRPFATDYGLIYDFHTVVNTPAVWRDALTIEHASFRAPISGEVFYNGESRTLDSLGDLPKLAAIFAHAPVGSYEADWRHWAEMLNQTFQQYDLGRFFKSPGELCRLTGIEQGRGLAREVEAVRLSDAASGLAINGWESHPTAWTSADYTIPSENYWTSGLVDTLRNFNFPPEILARGNEPVHLAVIPLPGTVYVGSKLHVDVTLINEKQIKGPASLTVQIISPDGKAQAVTDERVNIQGDALKFVQPLAGIDILPRGPSRFYRVCANLRLDSGEVVEGEQSVLAENSAGWKLPATGIQLEDPTRTLSKYFEAKTIFYPGILSPSAFDQPVLLIYNPEGSGFDSSLWTPEALTREASERGRTVLFWAADTAHGKTVTDLLRKIQVIPGNAQMLRLKMDYWGGWEFDTPHPIFAGLPAPVIFDNYFSSAYAYWGISNFPGKMFAGLLNAPPELAVTVGELPFGKGRILVCSMNLLPYLDKDPVADRILAQMLNYAVNTALPQSVGRTN